MINILCSGFLTPKWIIIIMWIIKYNYLLNMLFKDVINILKYFKHPECLKLLSNYQCFNTVAFKGTENRMAHRRKKKENVERKQNNLYT